MSRTQAVISLLFAILMAVLAMNIHMPVRTDYAPFAEHYRISSAGLKSSNTKILESIQRGISHYYMREESGPRALRVDSVVMSLYEKLEACKQDILRQSGYDSSLSTSTISERKSKKIIEDYFMKMNVADSIHYRVYKTFKCLWSTLWENDYERIEDVLYDWYWQGVIGIKQNDTLRLYRNDRRYTVTDNWCRKLFKNADVPSAYVSLSLLQFNLLATEHFFLERAFEDAHFSCSLYLDTIASVIIPRQALVLPEDTVRSDIFLFALATERSDLYFHVNQGKASTAGATNRNYGAWTNIATDLGTNIVTGTATIVNDNETTIYPWTFSYFVAAPGASLQLDNTRYCYRGIANPVSISVPGYSEDKLSLRVPGATVKMIEPGSYEIWINGNNTKELTAYIDATNAKGMTTTVDKTKLKIRDVPAPLATVNGLNEFVDANVLKKRGRIKVSPSDSDFVLNYKVVSYQFSILKNNKQFVGPFEGKDPMLNNEKDIMSAINTVERGDKLYITDIVVTTGRNNINLLPVVVSIR